MPRNYKKKKEKKYDETLLEAALAEIASGSMTVGKAAKQFGVPKETLRRQTVSGQPFRLGSGRQAVLTPEEENHIAVALDYLGRCGFPQGRETLKVIYPLKIKRKLKNTLVLLTYIAHTLFFRGWFNPSSSQLAGRTPSRMTDQDLIGF